MSVLTPRQRAIQDARNAGMGVREGRDAFGLPSIGTPPQTPWQLQPFGPDGQGWSPQVATPNFPVVGGGQATPIGGAPVTGGNSFQPAVPGTGFHGPTNGFAGVRQQNSPFFQRVREMIGSTGTSVPAQGGASAPASKSASQPKMTIQGGSMEDILSAIQGRNTMEMQYTPGNMDMQQQGQNPAQLMQELLDKLNERRTERTTRARANRGTGRTTSTTRSSTRTSPSINRKRMNDLW